MFTHIDRLLPPHTLLGIANLGHVGKTSFLFCVSTALVLALTCLADFHLEHHLSPQLLLPHYSLHIIELDDVYVHFRANKAELVSL